MVSSMADIKVWPRIYYRVRHIRYMLSYHQGATLSSSSREQIQNNSVLGSQKFTMQQRS
jgi:hypothetical protein